MNHHCLVKPFFYYFIRLLQKSTKNDEKRMNEAFSEIIFETCFKEVLKYDRIL